MPFRYEAYNREAQLVRGTIDVETREAAEQSLWEGDLTILALRQVGKPFLLHEQLPSVFGVRSQDVIAFANMLRRVAGYMERQKSAAAKVKGSLAYPVFVLCTAGIALYILMAVALPNLIGLFKEFKADLPHSPRDRCGRVRRLLRQGVPTLTSPPGGAIATDSGNKTSFTISAASQAAGAYTVYFYDDDNKSIAASSGSVTYQKLTCP